MLENFKRFLTLYLAHSYLQLGYLQLLYLQLAGLQLWKISAKKMKNLLTSAQNVVS